MPRTDSVGSTARRFLRRANRTLARATRAPVVWRACEVRERAIYGGGRSVTQAACKQHPSSTQAALYQHPSSTNQRNRWYQY
eukprot:5960728-Lingulodinium_polyedra.AAC.1